MRARALGLLLVLALGPGAGAAEAREVAAPAAGPTGAPAATPAPAGPSVMAAPPSALGGAVRVGLALVAVVAVMLGAVVGHRWLLGVLRPPARGTGAGRRGWFSRFILPGHEGDRVDVLARSWVGAKESVCLIRAGNDRFLVGVTTARVSLLGRLDAGAAAAGPAAAPAAGRLSAVADHAAEPAPAFARELAAAAARGAAGPAPAPAGPPPVTEASIREAMAQLRQRRSGPRRPAPVEVHVA